MADQSSYLRRDIIMILLLAVVLFIIIGIVIFLDARMDIIGSWSSGFYQSVLRL
ncbi:hypothetical protein ACFL2M_01285 [Patescibacteria group bacterium]